MVSNPSAIDIAWADPVFRVTGLKGRSRGAMKAFFGLSDAQFDRIASGSCRVPLRPAWQVAARIGNVADPRLKRPLLISILVIIAVFIGIVRKVMPPSSLTRITTCGAVCGVVPLSAVA